MKYDEIYRPLSRTNFDSKMMFAFQESIKTMSVEGRVEPDIQIKLYLPEEIEVFVLNSVMAKEYRDDDMTFKQFIDIMNAIRNYQPSKLIDSIHSKRIDGILITNGPVQFESQEFSIFRLYRHQFLFSFENDLLDMNKEFKNKFVGSFYEYSKIVFLLQVILSYNKRDEYFYIANKLINEYPWFIDNLKLTRDNYKEELNKFTKDKYDYRYCLRPSYSYPFVEFKDKIFLPTPHLLIQSITTGMMNRLTFGNDKLREDIGKYACEEYLYNIVKESELFDEVKREYEYEKGQKTLDVMVRKGDVALLIDSKFFSPKIKLRLLDEKAYKDDLKRIVKDMIQAYKHAHDKFNVVYNPFLSKANDVYALVVVYNESYIDYDDIYKETARKLLLDLKSEDYQWLCHHIGVTDLATIERFMLTATDIFPEIVNLDASLSQWFNGENGSNLQSGVLKYREKLLSDVKELYNNMLESS